MKRHRFKSCCGDYIYHIAIIDYLQHWNTEKQIESAYKVVIKNQNEYLVSAVNPDIYGKRFVKFMKTKVIINQTFSHQVKAEFEKTDLLF